MSMIQTNPETQNALPELDSGVGGSVRTRLATLLRQAAAALHEKSSQGGLQEGRSQGLGHAADWLDQSADYVKQADMQQVKADVANQIRRNPGRSLLVAGAVGLFLGALIRRR
jgi:ElaB/YqjD/DUF883 family membrane-anchored ribosome-binding protein